MKQLLNQTAAAGDRMEKERRNWSQIRVQGHLGNEWSDWFGGLELERTENGEMILSGRIVDQAALIGILSKLNRLNLIMTSICWSQEAR